MAAPLPPGRYACRVTDDTPAKTTRVVRSFAFIDLSGFTRYTNTAGDGAAVEVLSTFRQTVREVCALRGVRVAKWLGDGAMLVAIEPEPAIEAMVDIEQRIDQIGSALPLRGGIARGPVILFEGDDYIGPAVNLAARLCDLAEPHEILAPDPMVSSMLVNTSSVPIGEREVRGLDEPVALVRLDAVDPHQ